MEQHPEFLGDGDYVSLREIARMVELARKTSGLSPQDVAEQLGVPNNHIRQAENQPNRDLLRLRRKMLELFTGYTIDGPYYQIRKKAA